MNQTEKIKYAFGMLTDLKERLIERRVTPSKAIRYPHSFLNMQDFLSLKKYDLRKLQEDLTFLGLSSLTRSHFHLMHTISQERRLLELLQGKKVDKLLPSLDVEAAQKIMTKRAAFLKNEGSDLSVMLTLPSDTVTNPDIIDLLSKPSITIVRINTAHDTLTTWQEMADMVTKLNRTDRKENPIKIYVDLAGPKIRTGKIVRVAEAFDACGKVHDYLWIKPPSAYYLTHDGCTTKERVQERCVTIVVNFDFFDKARYADGIEIEDDEHKPRYFSVLEANEERIVLECGKKVHISPDTRLTIQSKKRKRLTTHPEQFSKIPQTIRVFQGDVVLITDGTVQGSITENKPYKAKIPCEGGKQIFQFIRSGDTIFIDDGKIELSVIQKSDEGLLCKVIRTKPTGTIVKEEKGINFPDTDIELPAITEEDKKNFDNIVNFADIIGISFAQSPNDVTTLQAMLDEKGKKETAIVAKIETKSGVHRLPMILYPLFKWNNGAVMLARGDLAIEVGFENLGRIQEEILDLCEAAHTPVIYATQILENLMKKNLPSRAEIIDASISQRTDCVMLNKGPFATRAVECLEKIVSSMQPLYQRSCPQLNRIHEWDGFRDGLIDMVKMEDYTNGRFNES